MRVIGLIRVSTDKQELSPEAQEREIERWASLTGAHVVALEYELGVSGATPLDERTALLRAIERVGENRDAEALLVLRRDRLARSVVQACAIESLLERQGGRVIAVDGAGNGDEATDKLIRQVLDAFAEYERAVIRLRILSAFERKRELGECLGEAPYGWRRAIGADGAPGKRLEEDEAEQSIRRRILAAHERRLSYRAIARALNEQNIPARGAKWHPTTVKRVIERAVQSSA